MSAEIPIIFSAPMIRRIFAGGKSKTRRIYIPKVDKHCRVSSTITPDGKVSVVLQAEPPHQPGDILWVREACRAEDHTDSGYGYGIRYPADDTFRKFTLDSQEKFAEWLKLKEYCGKTFATIPPIHMPRWVCRLRLQVTSIRFERLNEITDEDAIAEGIYRNPLYQNNEIWTWDGEHGNCTRPMYAFQQLWESIHGKGSWKKNPTVEVIGFKEVKPDVLLVPDKWGKATGIEVIDPDGWDRTNPDDWNTPIDLEKFLSKAAQSTVRGNFPVADIDGWKKAVLDRINKGAI